MAQPKKNSVGLCRGAKQDSNEDKETELQTAGGNRNKCYRKCLHANRLEWWVSRTERMERSGGLDTSTKAEWWMRRLAGWAEP